jgi:hypothetical protein
MPMVLHGLYDTLLKKDYSVGALVVAVVSFVYLAGLIEWSLRKKDLTMPARRGARAALA